MSRLESVVHYLSARRHSALLLTIVAMFAVRPFLGENRFAAVVFSVAMLVVTLVSLLTVHVDELMGERNVLAAQRRRRILVVTVLAVAAIVERVWVFYQPQSGMILMGAVSWLLFFAYVTWSQFRILLKEREVTGETISMSMEIYLLIGLCWTLLYIVIFLTSRDSFDLKTSAVADEGHVIPLFLYFSLTTLSTIGFGDITPLSLPARYAAVAEGIVGQLYLAILVARLVGMQMMQAPASSVKPVARDRPPENPDR